MILQWCDQQPCLGAMCPDALRRYGQPTVGHTIPVPPDEHSKAAILDLFERHLTTAVVRDPEGNPRRLPADLAFTIHTVITTLDGPRQYYTAMYSGTGDLESVLRAAPLAVDEPQDEVPPADARPGDRWGWAPDMDAVRQANTDYGATVLETRDETPELQPPGVATQDRRW
jgi:hypothetical protein